jgi:hypothetical protein
MYRIPGFLLLLVVTRFPLLAQVNINTSPARLYYTTAAGSSSTQHISIANRGNKQLELVVTVSDWAYDSLGNNHFYDTGMLPTSCAGWITVKPGPYISLDPKEQTVITVTMKPPLAADTSTIPVRTAMVFLTQLNPSAPAPSSGASVKIALQVGTKIYHSFSEKNRPSVEITNFMDLPADTGSSKVQERLELSVQNNGQGWVEGEIETELFNKATGKKLKLEEVPFYSLPGDRRKVYISLPKGLERGTYTATAVIRYGNKTEPEIAELEFYLIK